MKNVLKLIRASGAKITKPRKEIIKVLWEKRRPLTLQEIQRLTDNEIDFASIYRNVKLFVSIGFVKEVMLGDRKYRYELELHDHHHHVVCKECNKMQRIDLCISSEVEKITNYKIINHFIEFVGICPECLKAKNT